MAQSNDRLARVLSVLLLASVSEAVASPTVSSSTGVAPVGRRWDEGLSVEVASQLRGMLPAGSDLRAVGAWDAASGGKSLRLQQTVHGYPVWGAEVTLRLDRAGRLLYVNTEGVAPIDAAGVSRVPRVTVGQASATARASVPVPQQKSSEPLPAVLVVVPAGGGRLVWLVDVAPLVPTSRPEALVDAVDGTFLGWFDRARKVAARGRVFRSPLAAGAARRSDGSWTVASDTFSTVPLADLGDVSAGGTLQGRRVVGYNCCPTMGCDGTTPPPTTTGQFPIGAGAQIPFTVSLCDERPRAQADADGLFSADPAPEPASATAPVPGPGDGDALSEINAYRAASSLVEYVRALDPSFELAAKARPLRVTANYLVPDFQSIDWAQVARDRRLTVTKLSRFDNAAYVPAGVAGQTGIPGLDRDFDSILLFQGTRADFGYDTDVVVHETGHGLVEATARLLDFHADAQGIIDAPGAVNEALADFWAAALSGDPRIGEYVGEWMEGSGEGALRDLDNDFSCPTVLAGEVHQDSQHFSAALWSARQRVATADTDRLTFDRAVLSAMRLMAPFTSFDSAAEVIAMEVGQSMGEASAAQVRDAFVSRKVIGCDRVLDLAPGAAREGMTLIAPADTARAWRPYAPGPLQYRLNAPAGTTGVKVVVQGRSQGGGGGPGGFGGGAAGSGLRALLKPASMVRFSYARTGITSDAAVESAFTGGGNKHTAQLAVESCGTEPLYLALGNTVANGQWMYESVSITYTVDPAKASACAPPPPVDAGGGGGIDEAGCSGGCTAVDVSGLAAMALLVRRRRRTGIAAVHPSDT